MARKRPGNRLTDLIIVIALALTVLFIVSSIMRVKPAPPPIRLRPQDIKIEVLNGCGETGVAGQVRRMLQDSGFDVVLVENAEMFSYPITIVKDRRGNPEAARMVGEALGRAGVIQAVDRGRLLDITVVVGRDYRQILYPGKRGLGDRITGSLRED